MDPRILRSSKTKPLENGKEKQFSFRIKEFYIISDNQPRRIETICIKIDLAKICKAVSSPHYWSASLPSIKVVTE